MKIAITAHGENRHSTIDTRFGRADYFVLYDQESDTWSSLPNAQNLEAAHGAGIQAGQTIAKAGVKVLITGHVGPKAFTVLRAEKIAMYSCDAINATVEDALAAFLAGKLSNIDVAGAMGAGK